MADEHKQTGKNGKESLNDGSQKLPGNGAKSTDKKDHQSGEQAVPVSVESSDAMVRAVLDDVSNLDGELFSNVKEGQRSNEVDQFSDTENKDKNKSVELPDQKGKKGKTPAQIERERRRRKKRREKMKEMKKLEMSVTDSKNDKTDKSDFSVADSDDEVKIDEETRLNEKKKNQKPKTEIEGENEPGSGQGDDTEIEAASIPSIEATLGIEGENEAGSRGFARDDKGRRGGHYTYTAGFDNDLIVGSESDDLPAVPVGKIAEDELGQGEKDDLTQSQDELVQGEKDDLAQSQEDELGQGEKDDLTQSQEDELVQGEKDDLAQSQDELVDSDMVDTHRQIDKIELAPPSEDTGAMKLARAMGSFFSGFPGLITKISAEGSVFWRAISFIKRKLILFLRGKFIVIFLLIGLITGGIYYAYANNIFSAVLNFFASLGNQKQEVIAPLKVNPEDLRQFGLNSAYVFGSNRGSVNDIVPVAVKVATFFGQLQEPKISGETGISAATYYGEIKDDKNFVNQFVSYVQNLEKLRSLYKTDVYAMLDQKTDRAKALLEYLDQLQKAYEKSSWYRDQIGISIDEFKASYNSLTPDKTKYEEDFFTNLEALYPEKSDVLLKGFIDVSQKQVALKARINALSKVQAYYETALKRLEVRIQVVDKNRDALIQGIRVVDVPGSDLDIIVKQGN